MEAVNLFEQYVKLIEKIGPITIEPKKTSISFLVRVRFGGATIRKDYLEARLWLRRDVKHPTLRRTEKVTARDFVHYFRIQSAEDMDKDFVPLLREAYAIGKQEHLKK